MVGMATFTIDESIISSRDAIAAVKMMATVLAFI
jgi:hypothetical protein